MRIYALSILLMLMPATSSALKAPDQDALQTPPPPPPASAQPRLPATPAAPPEPVPAAPSNAASPEKIKADSAVSFPVDI